MAARKEQNLLEQALRIAQASGRSHQSRLVSLLRLAVRNSGLTSATLLLPDATLDAFTGRLSTSLPPSSRSCLIPFGQGCAGLAASASGSKSSPVALLHPDEPASPDERSVLSLPLLDDRRLAAVLNLGSAQDVIPAGTAARVKRLFPVFMLLIAAESAALLAGQERRDLSLIASLGRLLNRPLAPNVLLTKLLALCNGSGLSRCAVIRLTEGEKSKPRLFRNCAGNAREALPELLRAEPGLADRALADGATCIEPLPLAGFAWQAVCVPLGGNCRTLGTLTLFGGPALIAPGRVQLAETVARLVSSALGEAISSRQILSFAKENDQKLKELSLLYRMSNTMLSTIKLNKLIHLTLTALTSGPTPFFDRAMLFLSNERSGKLIGMLGVTREHSPPLSFQHGGDDILSSRWDISAEDMAAQRESDFCRQVLGLRLKLNGDANVASRAVLEKRLIHLPAGAGSPGDEPTHGRGALAASPLIAHGLAVGAVMVDNLLTGQPISQEDLRFLQLFTNQAGMAIENSMLFNRLEEANRQLGEAQESLLQKERLAAIGEMAAGIAHELKGPLVSIGGFAGRLTRKLPRDSHEWGHADLIVREVLRLEGILSEILLFSKKSTICYARCNISGIVRDSLAVVGPPMEEKGIVLAAGFPDEELELLGDSQQLEQVFINILLNALDAMGEGGKLSVGVYLDKLDGKDAVCVRIADTGGGIPLESLNSIFTPFYTTKESGTGLGLPIANRIIINHGGKIQVTNTPGEGAEFRVLLPKQC